VSADLALERTLLDEGYRRVIAIDEVGRGALAGPVSVAAVVIDVDVIAVDPPAGIDDSKRLTAKRRREIREPIGAWVRGHHVGHTEAARIDEVGIMVALGEAASAAIDGLPTIDEMDASTFSVVLLDGTFDFLTPVRPGFEVRTVVGGDGRCASIAAASILAKEERDELMRRWHQVHPQYGWDTNVGYAAASHRRAIAEFGACDLHRRSWRLV